MADEAEKIAVALGEPTDGLIGIQHMRMGMSPSITVSMLHYAGTHPVKPFRMTDASGQIIASLFPDEQTSPDDVTKLATVFDLERHKTIVLVPAMYAAVPDLDPEAPVLRGLTFGGKQVIADVAADGTIKNLRPHVEPPVMLEKNGVIELYADHLPDDVRSTLTDAATAASDKVLVKSEK